MTNSLLKHCTPLKHPLVHHIITKSQGHIGEMVHILVNIAFPIDFGVMVLHERSTPKVQLNNKLSNVRWLGNTSENVVIEAQSDAA